MFDLAGVHFNEKLLQMLGGVFPLPCFFFFSFHICKNLVGENGTHEQHERDVLSFHPSWHVGLNCGVTF